MRRFRSFLPFSSLLLLLACSDLYGDIVFDAVTSAVGPNEIGATYTLTHTIGLGNDRMVVIFMGWEAGAASVQNVTFDGVGCELVGVTYELDGPDQRVETWRIMDASISGSGAKDVVVTMESDPGSASVGIAVLSYTGVSQGDVDATASNSILDTQTIDTTITTGVANALIVSNVGNGQSGNYTSHGPSLTERWDQTPSSAVHSGATGIIASAGQVTVSATSSDSSPNRQAHFVASFAPGGPPPPDWWDDALNANPSDDFAPALIGQAKNFARVARLEMDANFAVGAGNVVVGLVDGWAQPGAGNKNPINNGQIKNLAQGFYDRLIEIDIMVVPPWTTTIADDNDHGMANIGQLKYAFHFEIPVIGADTDDDGMPDAHETAHGLNPNDSADAGLIDSDHSNANYSLTNLEVYRLGLDPATASTLDTGGNIDFKVFTPIEQP